MAETTETVATEDVPTTPEKLDALLDTLRADIRALDHAFAAVRAATEPVIAGGPTLAEFLRGQLTVIAAKGARLAGASLLLHHAEEDI